MKRQFVQESYCSYCKLEILKYSNSPNFLSMDDIPKFKQKITLALVKVNVNKDQKKFGDTTQATDEQPSRIEGQNVTDTIKDDTRWFRTQYVENIGIAERKKTKIRDVVKKLFTNRKHVEESDTYIVPVNPKRDAHHFTRPYASLMKKCLCEDFECVCKGCTLMPPKEMPTGPVNWIDWNDLFTYTNRLKIPAGTLIPSLRAKIKEEFESPAYLMSEGAVNPDCPEFCGSRCVAFNIPDVENDSKYWYTPEQIEKLKNIENTFNQQNRPKEYK